LARLALAQRWRKWQVRALGANCANFPRRRLRLPRAARLIGQQSSPTTAAAPHPQKAPLKPAALKMAHARRVDVAFKPLAAGWCVGFAADVAMARARRGAPREPMGPGRARGGDGRARAQPPPRTNKSARPCGVPQPWSQPGREHGRECSGKGVGRTRTKSREAREIPRPKHAAAVPLPPWSFSPVSRMTVHDLVRAKLSCE
jgi:hypothetical protein